MSDKNEAGDSSADSGKGIRDGQEVEEESFTLSDGEEHVTQGDGDDAVNTDAPPEKAADEVYCTSCGEAIKASAEICPECGVRQRDNEQQTVTSDTSLTDRRKYELQKLASKDVTMTMLVSFLLTPAGYLMVGKTKWAILNFFTLNYLLFGFVIVPLHTRSMIKNARDELRRHNMGW